MASPVPDRQFTDREAALILRTAAELQEHDGPHAPRRGLSLAQLEQVAVEAGIDPALVRQAVARLDDGSAGTRGGFLGAPSEVIVERTVPGEVDPERYDAVLEALRRAAGSLGEPSLVGRMFGWKGQVAGAKAEVAVSPVDGRTTVRVRVDLEELAVGHFMMKGVLGGVGGGLVAAGAASTLLGPIGAAVGAVVLGGSYLWARTGFTRGAAAYRARAVAVAESVVEALSEAVAP
jgi:hypothetical protein